MISASLGACPAAQQREPAEHPGHDQVEQTKSDEPRSWPMGLAGLAAGHSPRAEFWSGTPTRPVTRKTWLCRTFGGDGVWCYPSRMRWRSRVNPARPYICRLIIFVLVFTPSVRPL